jgi:multicomponent Na+:H+ antiporter subunit D
MKLRFISALVIYLKRKISSFFPLNSNLTNLRMGTISSIYLMIFLPLISSLLCQAFARKKMSFYFAITSCLALFYLLLSAVPKVLLQKKISSDFELFPLSIALEFRLDLLSITFLLLTIFVKVASLLFYKSDVDRLLDQKNSSIFYGVFLLQLFGLVGIFTSDNLLNLFLFFEVYAFGFFANLTLSRDGKLLELFFRYFCLNAASSLLILFTFFTLYLAFGEVNFEKLSTSFSLLPQEQLGFATLILLILSLCMILKFFPFWLYFKKIKSSELVSNFLAIDSLFIKTNIGIFLALKFGYFFFGKKLLFEQLHIAPLVIGGSLLLIIYSALALQKQKHLKLISVYLCLNNVGFSLAAIAIHSKESLQALFFYLLNFNLVVFFIFIFASFLKRHFLTSSLTKIHLIRRNSFLLLLPLKILVFFVAAFPFTLLFFANWYMAYSSLQPSFVAVLLIGVALSTFAASGLGIRLIDSFFAVENEEKNSAPPRFLAKEYSFYFASFWFLILLIGGGFFFVSSLNEFSLQFASYLLSNSL